jgi:hypothetical protein
MNDARTSNAGRLRLHRCAAALLIGLVAASLLPEAAGGAEDEFIPGSGQGYAQTYRAGPTAGRLSLAPIFGLSLSDYLNTVGRGEAKMADWAGIGVAERSLPDNTPALKVASTQEGSDKGTTMYADGRTAPGDAGGQGAGELFARATDAPLGESRVRMDSLGVPMIFEAKDTQARTVTAIVKPGLRESVSTTDIGSLVLFGGIVKMQGLHWRAVQQSGSKETVTGSFTVDGVFINGIPVSTPEGGTTEFASVLGPINAAVKPTGFAVSAPEVQKRSGQATVTPMSIDIVNSPAGRQYLAPVLGDPNVQGGREQIADVFIDLAKALVEANEEIPDATVAVLAADLTIGIFSGSSQLHLEFGGVSSFTEGETFENPFTGGFSLKPPVVGGNNARTVFTPGRPGTPGTPGTAVGDGDDTGSDTLATAPTGGTRTVPGKKGGAAVAVGLIGIAVALGLATADWFKMRSSRRALAEA